MQKRQSKLTSFSGYGFSSKFHEVDLNYVLKAVEISILYNRFLLKDS